MKVKKAIIIAFLFVLLFSSLTLSVFAYDYYIVNESTGKYHKPSCSYLPDESNSYEISSSSYRLDRLSPCKHCKPYRIVTDDDYSDASSNASSAKSDLEDLKDLIIVKILCTACWISAALLILVGPAIGCLSEKVGDFFLNLGGYGFIASVALIILGSVAFWIIGLFV